MESKRKKVLTYAAVGVASLSIIAGTLSYFTDRVEQSMTINTSGSVDTPAVGITPAPDTSVDPDDPTLGEFEDPTPDDTSDDLENWWKFLNSKALANFNPGDKLTLNFNMENTGTLAVDLQESFTVTSSLAMSEAPEFRLFSSVSEDANGAAIGEEVVVKEEKLDDYTYQYTIDQYTLSGSEEAISGCDSSVEKKYYLVFDVESGNPFQAATCQIDYAVDAKQHIDSASSWSTAAAAHIETSVAEMAASSENIK